MMAGIKKLKTTDIATEEKLLVRQDQKERGKGLSTTRKSRSCTVDDHRMRTGRVQHGQWSLFFLFGEWTPESRWHVLARVYCAKNRMLLAQRRTICTLNIDSFLDSCEKTTEVKKMRH